MKHTTYLPVNPDQATVKTDCEKRVPVEEVILHGDFFATSPVPDRDSCPKCAHVHAHSVNVLVDILRDGEAPLGQKTEMVGVLHHYGITHKQAVS